MKNLSLIVMLIALLSCSKEEIIEVSPLSRSEVQQELKSGTTVKALLDQGVRKDSLYGLDYQGGYIFSINDSDGSDMVISKSNVGSYPDAPAGRDLWTPSPHTQLNVTAEEIGAGASNTSKIVESVGDKSYAANSCHKLNQNGYDDWYLPSIKELEVFYQNMQEKGYSDILAFFLFGLLPK